LDHPSCAHLSVDFWKTWTLTSWLKVTDEEDDSDESEGAAELSFDCCCSPRTMFRSDDENFPLRRHDPLGGAGCREDVEWALLRHIEGCARYERDSTGSDDLDQELPPKIFLLLEELGPSSQDLQLSFFSDASGRPPSASWCCGATTTTLVGTGSSLAGAPPFFSQYLLKIERRLWEVSSSPEMADITETESSSSSSLTEEQHDDDTESSWRGGRLLVVANEGRDGRRPASSHSPSSSSSTCWPMISRARSTILDVLGAAAVIILTPSTEGLGGHEMIVIVDL